MLGQCLINAFDPLPRFSKASRPPSIIVQTDSQKEI